MKRFARIVPLLFLFCLLASPGAHAQTYRNVSGTISANGSAVIINTLGMGTVRFVVSGTWSGTLTFKTQAADGSTWLTESAFPYAPSGSSVSTVSYTGSTQTFKMGCAGQMAVQLVATAWVSGTANIYETASSAVDFINTVTPSGTSTTVTGNVASGATDSGNPVKVGGVYNTSAPTLTNGQRGDAQMDSAANLKVYSAGLLAGEDLTNNVLGTVPKVPIASTYSPSSYQSAVSGSLVVSANIKNTAAQLLGIHAANGNAGTRYLWITNATSAPAGALASSDSSVVYIYTFFTLTTRDFYYTGAGKNFATGLSFGWSTSATSYTAATATDHTLDVDYF